MDDTSFFWHGLHTRYVRWHKIWTRSCIFFSSLQNEWANNTYNCCSPKKVCDTSVRCGSNRISRHNDLRFTFSPAGSKWIVCFPVNYFACDPSRRACMFYRAKISRLTWISSFCSSQTHLPTPFVGCAWLKIQTSKLILLRDVGWLVDQDNSLMFIDGIFFSFGFCCVAVEKKNDDARSFV